jgi:hypothetical protein
LNEWASEVDKFNFKSFLNSSKGCFLDKLGRSPLPRIATSNSVAVSFFHLYSLFFRCFSVSQILRFSLSTPSLKYYSSIHLVPSISCSKDCFANISFEEKSNHAFSTFRLLPNFLFFFEN